MAWTRPENYSRREINKAGETLIGAVWSTEVDDALKVINNFRSSHGYPLNIFTKRLKKQALKIDKDALVAQRLKRLISITEKLQRFPQMQLVRMQDIAGCRAVLNNVHQVEILRDQIFEGIGEAVKLDDYIAEPKLDGYRSVHIVGRYKGSKESSKAYDGMCVEIQLRSRLQHTWATAVETVSAFTKQRLKSNIGDDDWKRFFALMGTAIARLEQCPIVPGTPERAKELIEEIRSLDKKLNITDTLAGFRVVAKETEGIKNAVTFLLELDIKRQEVRVTQFTSRQSKFASQEYLRIEKLFANDDSVQVVLVSVDSLKTLRSAYPNYYLDTSDFLNLLQDIKGLDI